MLCARSGWLWWMLFVAGLAGPALAVVPYPACAPPNCDPTCALGDASCTGPDDYEAYLFLPPGVLPNDYNFNPNNPTSGSSWLYQGVIQSGPAAGVFAGNNVVGAWQISTGRPDVVGAVLDSGIRWSASDLARTAALHTGELPLPAGCHPSYDCDGNGVVNVSDFAGAACAGGAVSDANGNQNGVLDPQDLILLCSDGFDDDDNGYVDDIAGWDFHEDDNDPFDDVDYGHGTGEAADQVNEADNGGGQPGVAPASMFIPLKVGDSFVAADTDFAQAVIYAVDRGASYISEALGTLNSSPFGQAAVDYAYANDVPIIASAADEQARHHNYPSNYDHMIWVNSVRPQDGLFVEITTPPRFDLQNGCTNHGGKAWVAIGSNSCSSEATGRAGGMTSLLLAQGKNLMDRGLLSPHTPGSHRPFSAEEVRQLFRRSAIDIDHSADPVLPPGDIFQLVSLDLLLSNPVLGFLFGSSHFPDQSGWDQYTGYGRPDGEALLTISEETIPPEANLAGGLEWFDVVHPGFTPAVPVVGSGAAVRDPNGFDWSVQVGCGVQPTSFTELDSGSANAPIEQQVLAMWDPAATAGDCGFDPSDRVEEPDDHTVTLRLQVTDSRGNLGEDRRTVAIDADPDLQYPPIELGGSGESSPKLADVNGDGVLDIVHANGGGEVDARDGASGDSLAGFPVHTALLPVHDSPAFDSGAVPLPREALISTVAVDDLDGDGTAEVVAASFEGGVYAWDRDGNLLPGFPVRTNPDFSDPSLRDRFNDVDPGFLSSPTLVDLDPEGGDPDLEIVAGAMDGHLYAWNHDGTPVAGFPVKLADRDRLAVDPVSGKLTPLPGSGAQERLGKIVSSPAVGDLDGDGRPEIVVGTNESYTGDSAGFDADSLIFQILLIVASLPAVDLDEFSLDSAGRLYALNHDGSFVDSAAGEPASWPVPVPLLVPGILPTVAEGTPGSPALADIDDSGTLTTAIFPSAGPIMLYRPTGAPALPLINGSPAPLAIDFPDEFEDAGIPGFPAVPPTAGSGDAPFFGAVGSGAFGDLDGDFLPEYAAPTIGMRQVLDIAAPGSQEFSDHQLTAWEPTDGSLLPAFPRAADDLHFLTSPALADVSGDGVPDIVAGSGTYLVRAFQTDGSEVEGFPKFTHGWLLASVAVGDVDGDGRSEVVATSREGKLFVWDTPGRPHEGAIPWQGFGRDRRNTQNLASGVYTTIAACEDGRDNDGDGSADGLDTGCLSPRDASEVRGDLDFDGTVSESDKDVLFGAFASAAGDPRFLDPADFDRDGVITWVDYQEWLQIFDSFVHPALPEGFACGLLGIEPFLLLAALRVGLRRRRSRGSVPVGIRRDG